MKRTLSLAVLAALLTLAAMAALGQGTTASKAPANGTKVYVCTMCDFAGDKPGKCPECGMNLKEVNKADVSYVCTMCDVKSDKPGKCPKCGMTMKMKVTEPAPQAAPKTK